MCNEDFARDVVYTSHRAACADGRKRKKVFNTDGIVGRYSNNHWKSNWFEPGIIWWEICGEDVGDCSLWSDDECELVVKIIKQSGEEIESYRGTLSGSCAEWNGHTSSGNEFGENFWIKVFMSNHMRLRRFPHYLKYEWKELRESVYIRYGIK